MNEPKVIRATSEELYLAELSAYASPFLTLGFFAISVLPFSEADPSAAERLILARLDEIRLQIEQLKAIVEQRLAEATIRERTGEVLGIQEALDEFSRLHSQGILDNVVTDSATTKRKILGYLGDSDTPLS